MKLNIIASRIEIVRITTFDSEANYGYNIFLGDVQLVVSTVVATRTRKLGCTNDELVEEKLDVVSLDGRHFLLTPTSFWQESEPKQTVVIPYGFIPQCVLPRKCPYCGK